jgi:ComF family protein
MLSSNILREIFCPRQCLGCAKRGVSSAVCDDCLEAIPVNNTLFCGQCHARLPCQKKICHLSFPYLLGAAGEYDDPLLRTLIHALKFKRNREAADALGAMLAKYVERVPLDLTDFAIVPLPLSKRRARERGFNQSELIARAFIAYQRTVSGTFSATEKVPDTVLIRTHHTPPQSETKSVDERQMNVKNSFAVPPGAILPKRILLIDDVTTSGATFRAAATALKSAGARHIIALACAKA